MVAVTAILLLALLFVVCQRARVKRSRRHLRPHQLIIDHTNGKELVPLNSRHGHHNHAHHHHGHAHHHHDAAAAAFKRGSKMSNLEVSQVSRFRFHGNRSSKVRSLSVESIG